MKELDTFKVVNFIPNVCTFGENETYVSGFELNFQIL